MPALPIAYADYALWQRKVFDGALLAEQLAYWRRQLDGLGTLDLPTDHAPGRTRSSHGSNLSVALAPGMLDALRDTSARLGVTPFMTLLACFQLLLSRYAGQTDIAVGVPIANRTHVEAEALVGTLVNTLVMRCDLGGDPSFGDLLSRVQQTALDAYAHQDLPFEQLVEELRGPRGQNNSPLIRVLFNVLNTPAHHDALEGLSFEPAQYETLSSLCAALGEHYPVVHVADASRAVAVANALLSPEQHDGFMAEVRADYQRARERHENQQRELERQTLEQARANKLTLDLSQPIPEPSVPGVLTFECLNLGDLTPRIDWTPFFQAWELRGRHPAILDDTIVGGEAKKPTGPWRR